MTDLCPHCGQPIEDEDPIVDALNDRWDGYTASLSGLAVGSCPYKAVAVNRWTWEKKDWEKMHQWQAGWHIGQQARKLLAGGKML